VMFVNRRHSTSSAVARRSDRVGGSPGCDFLSAYYCRQPSGSGRPTVLPASRPIFLASEWEIWYLPGPRVDPLVLPHPPNRYHGMRVHRGRTLFAPQGSGTDAQNELPLAAAALRLW
jgi:hypothetical protein